MVLSEQAVRIGRTRMEGFPIPTVGAPYPFGWGIRRGADDPKAHALKGLPDQDESHCCISTNFPLYGHADVVYAKMGTEVENCFSRMIRMTISLPWVAGLPNNPSTFGVRR
jgi:hypothetical protein